MFSFVGKDAYRYVVNSDVIRKGMEWIYEIYDDIQFFNRLEADLCIQYR